MEISVHQIRVGSSKRLETKRPCVGLYSRKLPCLRPCKKMRNTIKDHIWILES